MGVLYTLSEDCDNRQIPVRWTVVGGPGGEDEPVSRSESGQEVSIRPRSGPPGSERGHPVGHRAAQNGTGEARTRRRLRPGPDTQFPGPHERAHGSIERGAHRVRQSPGRVEAACEEGTEERTPTQAPASHHGPRAPPDECAGTGHVSARTA